MHTSHSFHLPPLASSQTFIPFLTFSCFFSLKCASFLCMCARISVREYLFLCVRREVLVYGCVCQSLLVLYRTLPPPPRADVCAMHVRHRVWEGRICLGLCVCVLLSLLLSCWRPLCVVVLVAFFVLFLLSSHVTPPPCSCFPWSPLRSALFCICVSLRIAPYVCVRASSVRMFLFCVFLCYFSLLGVFVVVWHVWGNEE